MPRPEIQIIPLRQALKNWSLSRTNYYSRINPASPAYDPACPKSWPLGQAANSPHALTQAEIDNYATVLIERGRAAVAVDANGSRERAVLMAEGRRARRDQPQE